MCGICGAFGPDASESVISSMMESQRHRGPDDLGRFTDAGICLGHMRLSIIDLSENGRQPISNEDGSIWVTYNGEIYNFKHLRAKLESEGHEFKTSTDTEVLVHLYERDGADFIKHLRGMFSFAIWDSNKSRLICARDRFGIKPFYYTVKGGTFYFASELKALLEIPDLDPKLDRRSLDNYMSLQYVPGPETIIEGIHKLMPAHVMVVDKDKTEQHLYWDPHINAQHGMSLKDAGQKLLGLLNESVKMRLVADVPLGAFLSGGIDSSALVALMSSYMPDPVKTFSIGYGYEGVDELSWAKKVSDHLGTDHTEIILEADDVVDEFENIIWHLDEPIGDAALVSAYFLSKRTVKDVKVTFGGGGSDEIFAGYRAYKYSMLSHKLRQTLPLFARRNLRPLTRINQIPYRARKYIDYISSGEGDYFYGGQGTLFSQNEKDELYKSQFKESVEGNYPLGKAKNNFWENDLSGNHFLNRLLYTDIKGWLADDCLAQVDRMSMAHSLEARVPFLDHRLVEFAYSIPAKYKMRGWTEKYILRKVMENRLPHDVVWRTKKGFTVPTNQWLYNELWDYTLSNVRDSLSLSSRFFKKDAIDRLLKRKGDFRVSSKIFGLLVLDVWNKRFLRGG